MVQASALLAQDEFPTLGAPAAEPLPLPNGGPYAHAPQGYPNGIPSSHPHAERTSWDGPGHGAPYEKSGAAAADLGWKLHHVMFFEGDTQ